MTLREEFIVDVASVLKSKNVVTIVLSNSIISVLSYNLLMADPKKFGIFGTGWLCLTASNLCETTFAMAVLIL
jgi:hypothetical protein